MIRVVIFSCILLTVAAQFTMPSLSLMDPFLKQFGLQLDKDCTSSKISGYEKILKELDNCDNIKMAIIMKMAISPQFVKADNINNKFCGGKKLNKCSDMLKSRLNPCLNEAQKDILNYGSKSEDAIQEYICNDGINDLEALSNFDATKCSRNGNPKECSEKFSVSEFPKPEDYFNKENCIKLIGEANCLLNLFNSCEDKSVYKVLKKLRDADLNATPCKEYNSATPIFDKNSFTLLLSFTVFQFRNYFF